MTTRSFATLRVHALVCGLVTTLSLAGCGGDDEGPSGTAGDDAGAQDGSGDALLFDTQGDNGGGDGFGDGSCGGQTVVGQPVQVNLLVLVDRSFSMTQTPEGFTDTKWGTMVFSVGASLAGIQDKMAVGLAFFPDPATPAADGCGMSTGKNVFIGVDEGAVTVPLIQQALGDSANAPAGNTPTAEALALANRYFTTGPGAQLEGQKYVLLALDGGPNCNAALQCTVDACTLNIDNKCPDAPNSCCGDGSVAEMNKSCLDDTRTLGRIEELRANNVSTFVVGIPGSAPYANVLDGLAEAGGYPVSSTSPKYYQVKNPQELTDALEQITTQLVKTCEFQLAETPPNLEEVNVYLDGEVVPKEGADGWEYDNSTTPPTVVIKGQTCERLETQGAESVTFEFGCPTIK